MSEYSQSRQTLDLYQALIDNFLNSRFHFED